MIEIRDKLLGRFLGELDPVVKPCPLEYNILSDLEEGVKLIHHDTIVAFLILSGMHGSKHILC